MVEGLSEGKNIWVMRRDDFMDVGGPIFVKDGAYIKGVGGDKAVSWTRI